MARVDDEREHWLGRKCRACGEFVIDTYPGMLYVVDHTDPNAPPQLFDLMVYHSSLLPSVCKPKGNVTGVRACEDMAGVSASSIITQFSDRTLGYAQIVAADLASTLKFLQSNFGPISTWGQQAQLTAGYLQNDLKSSSHAVGYNPAFINRVIPNPSAPISAVAQSASQVITQLVDFKNAIRKHNERYKHASVDDNQPTKFAPSVLPATRPANLIVVQSYMTHRPGTITRARTHFGYIAYEFPKQTAFFILKYKESYINAAEQLNAITVKSWNEKSKLKFLNDLLASYQNNHSQALMDLKYIASHLKQNAAKYSTHGVAAIEQQIKDAIANTPTVVKKF